MCRFAEVIIDIAHAEVDRLFTYQIPDGMPVEPGHHVLIPFGNSNKAKEGFVIRLLSEPLNYAGTCKSILRIIEPYTVLTNEQLSLAFWIKKNYNCLLVDALRTMIPSGLRGAKVHEKTERTISLSPDADIDSCLSSLSKSDGSSKAPKQTELLRLFSGKIKEISRSDLTRFIPGSNSAINALVKKGILCENSRITFRTPDYSENEYKVPVLNETQCKAVKDIVDSVTSKASDIFLLHGVTGSGKTEVYLNCISACLASGRYAIVLVPEISLTPQTVSRFRSRFGSETAVLHSGLSAGERFDEWRRIRLGDARIVIGARSAVFAPLRDIGVIIIDEEHEGSYQSESVPRYNAADVAFFRAKEYGCPVVLGSATPSLLSYFRSESGRYRLLQLPERVMNRPLPAISLVDMRDEFLLGNNSIFSAELVHSLGDCLNSGKQSMLLLNRRGYSTFVMCRSCGSVLLCPQCDIPMTYHKRENRMQCHFCNSVLPVPSVCPVCGKPHIKHFGLGTEQVEEALYQLFPGVTVLRMDADTMTHKGAYLQTLSSFARGEAQVLIGTQMIAKGHDFPNVTLVGVVAADSGLNIPDYRSAERTFQLLTQVAGRAGRADSPGKVVIQTYNPSHYAVRFAKEHDYVGFYRHEIAERRKALFPPFTLFLRILLSDENEDSLNSFGLEYASALQTVLSDLLGERFNKEILLFLPTPAPIKKKAGIYRFQILIKLLRTKQTASIINTVYDFIHSKRSDHFGMVEINPSDML